MTDTILKTLTLNTISCADCGVVFAMPSEYEASRRRDQKTFYCPSGHGQSYSESEATRLARKLAAKETELRAEKCESLRQKQMRESVEAENARVNRKLKRVQSGVCPCCNRTFQDLQRHMATKHPEKS